MSDQYLIVMEILNNEISIDSLNIFLNSSMNKDVSGKVVRGIKEKLESVSGCKSKFDHGIDLIPKNRVKELAQNASKLSSNDSRDEDVSADNLLDKIAKKAKVLKNLCEEMINTETRYFEVLGLLKETMDNLNSCPIPQSDQKDFHNIMKNINVLYQLHEIINDRFQKLREDDDVLSIPAVFKDNCIKAYLNIYKDFMITYQENLSRLYVINKNTIFKQFCSKIILKHEVTEHHTKDCPGLYIQIQNRLTRYELLMKSFVKNTPPESENMAFLKDAIDLFSLILKGSQQALYSREKREQAMEIWNKLDKRDRKELAVNVEFLKSGPVKKIPRRSLDKRRLDRHFFLFSDRLYLTEPLNTSGTYTVKEEYGLKTLELTHIKEDEEDIYDQNCFRISHTKNSLEFVFASKTEMEDWFEIITKAIEEEQKKFHSFLQVQQSDTTSIDGKKAAVWVKDEYATMCAFCACNFTVTQRRHHCRNCGKVFCGKCSAYKAIVQTKSENEKPLVRVCVICYHVLNPNIKPVNPALMNKIHRLTQNLAIYKNGQWITKLGSLKELPFTNKSLCFPHIQEGESDDISIKRLTIGPDKSLIVNYGAQTSQFDLFSPSRFYVLLLNDSCLRFYAAKNDTNPRGNLVSLGTRIFYLDSSIKYRQLVPQQNMRRETVDLPLMYNSNGKPRSHSICSETEESLKRSSTIKSNDLSQSKIFNRLVKQLSTCDTDDNNLPGRPEIVKIPPTLRSYMSPVNPKVLAALRNEKAFLIMPGNSDRDVHYFEAPSKDLRDEWIAKIKSTVIKKEETSSDLDDVISLTPTEDE